MELFKLLGTIAIDSGDSESKLNNITSKASESSQKIGSVFTNIGTKAASVSKTFAPVTLAIGGAGTALAGLATKSAESMDTIDKMSQKIGISREAYQELDFICSQSGMSVDSLQGGMKTLTNQMQSAQAGTKSAVSAFESLGVSIYDNNGNIKDQETMMWEAISALQDMENQTEKAALANDLFGRSGSEMMPLLNGAAGSIEEMKQQAHDLGLVMSDESVDAGVEFTDTLDQFKRSATAAAASAGSELLPTFTNLLQLLIEKGVPAFQQVAEKIGEVVSWFTNLDSGQQKVLLTITAAIAAISPIAGIISGITTVLGVLIPVISGCAAAFGALNIAILPIAAAIAAVVAIGVVLYKNWDTIKEKAHGLGQKISESWSSIKQKTSETFSKVKEDISNSMASAKESISKKLEEMKNKFQEKWSSIKQKTSETYDKVKETMSNGMSKAKEIVSEELDDIKQKYEENGGGIKGAIKTYQDEVYKISKSAYDKLNEMTGGKFGDMLNTTKEKFDAIKNAMSDKIHAASDVVKEGIEKIKNFFKFEWSLPKIKLPHFSITGDFSLNPPSVPSFGIDWYAKAMDNPMIMNSPTAFGLNKNGQVMAGGEAGSEVVSGTDTLMNMISDAVSAKNEKLESILQSILEYMPQMANMKLVMDTGATVGALAPQMDKELGKRASRKGRNV